MVAGVLLLAGVLAFVGGGAVSAQDGGGDLSGADANEGGPGFVLPASRITAGSLHSCALLNNGTARCWGVGDVLGYGNTESIGDDEVPASAGPVDLGVGRTATAISAGGSLNGHSCALLDNGTVRCWGSAFSGELGYGNTDWIGDDEVPGSVGPVDLGAGRTATAIAAGGDHSCALLDNGTVRCWGRGDSGQLGYGNTDWIGDNETPGSVGPVDLGMGRTAVAITAGSSHTCAVLDDGTVRCWGAGISGKLGYGNTSDIGDNETPGSVGPVDLGSGRTALAVTAGGSHTCALLDNGTVRCWGEAGDSTTPSGALGYGNTNDIGDDETPGSVGPVTLGPGRTAVAVTAGLSHTCALLDDGNVRCWGANFNGELGYGNTNVIGDDETPDSVGPVSLGPGRTAVAITAGASQTCAVLDDGTVRCWGYGLYGALGYGNTNNIGDNETPGSVGPVDLGGLLVEDTDGDGVADVSDNCPAVANANQLDTDGDGAGDVCDADDDNDGVADVSDNCRVVKNADQANNDGDSLGDVCDPDDDNDGVADGVDNCPLTANPAQSDVDGDGPGDVCDSIDNRRNRIFVTNVIQSGPAEYDFVFGNAFEELFTGDWDGNGHDGFARRLGRTIVEVDERGRAIRRITFGTATDMLYRVGDWDGDNIDTFAVQRGNVFFVTNSPTGGPGPAPIGYGRAGDEVFVGDWNGNGQDTFAVRRGNVFYVRNSVTTGPADIVFGYGRAGDEVLIGDWDQDGVDTFAVRRGNVIFIRNDFQTGIAETVIGYGRAADTLLVGDWNGDNVDTFAVQRREL